MAEIKRVADGTMTDAALMAIGSAVDIWGTEQCVNASTCYEANSAGQTSGTARVALKAGLYPVKVGGCYVLRRTGHHKAARIVAILVTAVDVGLGVKAYRLSRQK